MTDTSTRSSRIKFLALVILFVGPVLVATGWYMMADLVQPETDSHGTLIDPARPLEDFQAQTLGERGYDLGALRGNWTLVHIVDGECGTDCRERIHYTRQIRDALGHDRIRVRRVVVVPAEVGAIQLASLLPEHPDLLLLHSERGLASQFPADREAATVFLVDPLGNLMMQFDEEVEPSGILGDLKKLLRVSRIG